MNIIGGEKRGARLASLQGKTTDNGSINILERIQSKIEEKMTRAETSNGQVGLTLAQRN